MPKAKKISPSVFPRFFLIFVIAFTLFIIGFSMGAVYYQYLYSAHVHNLNRNMIGHTLPISTVNENKSDWKTYQDQLTGLKLQYPQDWSQTTSTNFLRIVHTPSSENKYSLQMNFSDRELTASSLPTLKKLYITQKQQAGMQIFAACDCEIAKLKGFQVNGYYLTPEYQASSYETDYIFIDEQKKRQYEFIFTHAPQIANVDAVVEKIMSTVSY